MQSTELSERISPDITCISYGTNRSSSAAGSNNSVNTSVMNSGSGGGNLHTIAEVPPGLYEFIIGSNGEVKILCKICQYMSNKKSNFKRHFTNMHFVLNEDSTKTLECCGIRFNTKGEKFQHTKSVHKTGYKCSTCSKVFDRPALLQRHLAKHTGKKPYKCSLCSYQTPNKANAKRHIEKKHSDVQEGSILFVTDDGEQIQMEVVSKGIKEAHPILASTLQTPPAVVKSNADSTSFGSFADAFQTSDIPDPLASITSPRSRSASVTSSSLSPPGHLFVGPLNSVFDSTTVTDLKGEGGDKRRKITHSIDMIMKEHAQSHFVARIATPTNATTCCNLTSLDEGSNVSVRNPENSDSSKYVETYNHTSTINEIHMGNYCSPNWSHTSTTFPISNDYAASSTHQVDFLPQSTYTSAPDTNQDSSSFVFRQCAHGCWHHVDNQAASDFSSTFIKEASSSFVPTHFFSHHSPDLRSSSSSISQRTENSSIISVKSEDENDSDIIDVVGDDDDDGDDSSRRIQLLSSLCEGLGSFSTTELPSPSGGYKNEHFENPPVGSLLQRRSSFSTSSSNDCEEVQISSPERYVPKKLRVARGHTK